MKYFHLRYRWEDTVSANNPDGIHCRGGVTVAIENGHTDDVVRYAFAICSINDVYCRKIGRAIVEGRLAKGECYEAKVDPRETWGQVLDNVIKSKIAKKMARLFDEEDLELYLEALT